MDDAGREAPKGKWAGRRTRNSKLWAAVGAAVITGGTAGGVVIAGSGASTLGGSSIGQLSASYRTVSGSHIPRSSRRSRHWRAFAAPAVVGTVQSVDTAANSFTVKDSSGTTFTVDVSASTTFIRRRVTSPGLSSISVNTKVAVLGTTSSNTVTATTVVIGGARAHGIWFGVAPAVVGMVQSVDSSANSFTVKSPSGTVFTIDVSPSTTYVDPGITSPGLSDVTVNAKVAVVGTTSSNTVAATKVVIGLLRRDEPLSDGSPAVFGTVQSVDSSTNSFTVKSPSGTVFTIDVSPSTTYIDPGTTSPGLSDVTVNAHVTIIGTNASNTVTADRVLIGPFGERSFAGDDARSSGEGQSFSSRPAPASPSSI